MTPEMRTNSITSSYLFLFLSFCLFLAAERVSCAVPYSGPRNQSYIKYKIFGQKDGLSENKIQSIVKDSLGTFWIGTTKGLDRIFEKRVVSYNTPLLENRIIHFIARDDLNNIWVSASSGLFLYDYGTDSFSMISIEDKIKNHPDWYKNTSRGIVFCSTEGITRYSYRDGKYEMVIPRNWSEVRYNGFNMISDSVAVVSNAKGIVSRLNLDNGRKSDIYDFGEDISVKDIHIDSKDRIWLAVYGKGLFCISPETGQLIRSFRQGESFFHDSIILDLESRGDELWIATDGGGVYVMDTRDFNVSNLKELLHPEMPPESESVNTLYISDDEFWLGTIRHGLILPRSNYVRTFSGNDFGSYQSNGPNRSIVNCLCEDENGKIWLSTDGSGISSFDRKTGQLRLAEAFRKQKAVSIVSIDKNNLLVSIYNNGIYKYNTVTGETKYIHILDEKTNTAILAQDIIINLEKTCDGRILVLARNVFVYDDADCRIKSSGINLEGINNFQMACSDSLYTYVYTHYELSRINNRTLEAEQLYFAQTGDINCVRYNDGILWIIKSYSLMKFTVGTQEPEMIPFKYNGKLLPVIEPDANGYLWIATKENIIRYDPSDGSAYIKLGESDGVTYNDFIEGTTLLTGTGEIFFGGNSGLCEINAKETIPEQKKSRIYVLRANIDGENIDGSVNRKGSPAISIPWNYESMYFDIATTEGDVFKSNRFRYTIKGQGKNIVIYSGSRLSLPTLAAGKYDIDIAFVDNTDNWVESGSSISITVTPPWWKNIVFATSLFLLLAIGILVYTWIYNRREREKAARVYRERKEKLSENKLKFLTNISHELRTPLTLIYSPLKRLIERNSFPDEVEKDLKSILSQSKYMNQIINMVLDSRKLEEGFGQLMVSSHNLAVWVDDIINEFKMEYENKSISLENRISPEIGNLNFDESKFRIILSNLLMNAWKYSRPETKVVIKAEKTGGKTRISVIDEGVGISKEDADRIFDRFVQGESKANGFGLGLSYTKLLVEAHPGGRIGAYRNAEKGSTFWFEIQSDIPCETVESVQVEFKENACSPQNGNNISVARIDTSNCTLLIVEDEPDLLNFIKRELSGVFREIYTATDGNEALKSARKHIPNIIVSDVMMPGMNGYELCSRIKNDIEVSHIPVILLTAQTGYAEREAGYKSGADIFLTKPFDIPVLLAAISNTLSSRQLIKERYKNAFSSITAEESTFSNADEQFLLKLDKFIADNISNDSLNAQMIIEHLCMGRATFYKKVKEITGNGIMEYVTGKRMAIAAELLKTGNMSVADIALRVGYPDSQYFSKVFKQNFNMTPRAFRNNLTQEEKQ